MKKLFTMSIMNKNDRKVYANYFFFFFYIVKISTGSRPKQVKQPF